MEVKYKCEKKITVFDYNQVPKDVIEKQFIIEFFKSLPIEDLKRLINYKEINFKNQNIWGDSKLYDLLNQLRVENQIMLTAEIWLDNGVDTLSLG